MITTTYLLPGDAGTTVAHEVLGPLLADLRKESGIDWRIVPIVRQIKTRWWGRYRPLTVYNVLIRRSDICDDLTRSVQGIEYQVINFYIESSGTTINTDVSAGMVASYLFGIFAGRHWTK